MGKYKYSVVMPAYNESRNIADAITMVKTAFSNESFQLIVVDDGSDDNTAAIVSDIINLKDDSLVLLQNIKNEGRGAAIGRGYDYATGDNLIVIQAKKDTYASEIKSILSCSGSSDVVISYQANTSERPLGRQILSRLFTSILNISFKQKIKYYNGSCIIPRRLLEDIKVDTTSYAYDAELLLKLLKKGITYTEVAVIDRFEEKRRSWAFNSSNIIGVCGFYLRMIYHFYYGKN